MDRSKTYQALYERFIRPTETKRTSNVGIEIEMPIVNLSGEPTDQNLSKQVFNEFVDQFGFTRDKFDDNGDCFSATLETNQDNISFDCSYNNLELSLGKEEDIYLIQKRFTEYVNFLNEKLQEENHLVTGFGINPNRKVNDSRYIPAERYRMLERYLDQGNKWELPMYIHPYPTYGTFSSASQVQLDVEKDKLIDTIKAFSLLEPYKAVLFSNSLLDSEEELLCVRDHLWENSSHGINPHNIGMFEKLPEDIEELVNYIATTSIFNVERDGHYIHFKPIPITEFLDMKEVEGEYYMDGEYHPITFVPQIEDLSHLRTYKFEDLTFRGTIEFRSCCNQPFSEAMTVAAFHAGLNEMVPELLELLENDTVLYGHGYNASELRREMNQRQWPSFISKEELRSQLKAVLDLAREGLIRRGKKEEDLLEPLYKRAETLQAPGRKIEKALEEGTGLYEIVKEYAAF